MFCVICSLCMALPFISVHSELSFRLDLACASWWWLCIIHAACDLTLVVFRMKSLKTCMRFLVMWCWIVTSMMSFEEQMVADKHRMVTGRY